MSAIFDEQLFEATQSVGIGFNEVEWIADHLRVTQEEREHFLHSEIENPRFVYRAQSPKVWYHDSVETIRQLLKGSVAPAVVIDLYEHKLKKLEARTRLVEASLMGDDVSFFERSVELYGKPRKRHFSYVAKRVIELCKNTKNNYPTAARRLHKVLGRVSIEQVDIGVDILPSPVLGSEVITSIQEVEDIFLETLKRYNITDWAVEVDQEGVRRHFATRGREKKLFIPSERHLLGRPIAPTKVHIQAVAEHEIGVHVHRASKGAQSPLRLLEVGLDGYLKGEEGVASYVQQQVEGADEFYGFDRYLAAGLAVGMDGVPRDFRAVFSLMVDYYTLKFGADDSAQHPAPFRAAWDVCVRLFRGTTGQSVGLIYTKDIVYFEGNIGIWELLTEKPHVFPHLFAGKYNPLSKRHVNTLQTLEIVPVW